MISNRLKHTKNVSSIGISIKIALFVNVRVPGISLAVWVMANSVVNYCQNSPNVRGCAKLWALQSPTPYTFPTIFHYASIIS